MSGRSPPGQGRSYCLREAHRSASPAGSKYTGPATWWGRTYSTSTVAAVEVRTYPGRTSRPPPGRPSRSPAGIRPHVKRAEGHNFLTLETSHQDCWTSHGLSASRKYVSPSLTPFLSCVMAPVGHEMPDHRWNLNVRALQVNQYRHFASGFGNPTAILGSCRSVRTGSWTGQETP